MQKALLEGLGFQSAGSQDDGPGQCVKEFHALKMEFGALHSNPGVPDCDNVVRTCVRSDAHTHVLAYPHTAAYCAAPDVEEYGSSQALTMPTDSKKHLLPVLWASDSSVTLLSIVRGHNDLSAMPTHSRTHTLTHPSTQHTLARTHTHTHAHATVSAEPDSAGSGEASSSAAPYAIGSAIGTDKHVTATYYNWNGVGQHAGVPVCATATGGVSASGTSASVFVSQYLFYNNSEEMNDIYFRQVMLPWGFREEMIQDAGRPPLFVQTPIQSRAREFVPGSPIPTPLGSPARPTVTAANPGIDTDGSGSEVASSRPAASTTGASETTGDPQEMTLPMAPGPPAMAREPPVGTIARMKIGEDHAGGRRHKGRAATASHARATANARRSISGGAGTAHGGMSVSSARNPAPGKRRRDHDPVLAAASAQGPLVNASSYNVPAGYLEVCFAAPRKYIDELKDFPSLPVTASDIVGPHLDYKVLREARQKWMLQMNKSELCTPCMQLDDFFAIGRPVLTPQDIETVLVQAMHGIHELATYGLYLENLSLATIQFMGRIPVHMGVPLGTLHVPYVNLSLRAGMRRADAASTQPLRRHDKLEPACRAHMVRALGEAVDKLLVKMHMNPKDREVTERFMALRKLAALMVSEPASSRAANILAEPALAPAVRTVQMLTAALSAPNAEQLDMSGVLPESSLPLAPISQPQVAITSASIAVPRFQSPVTSISDAAPGAVPPVRCLAREASFDVLAGPHPSPLGGTCSPMQPWLDLEVFHAAPQMSLSPNGHEDAESCRPPPVSIDSTTFIEPPEGSESPFSMALRASFLDVYVLPLAVKPGTCTVTPHDLDLTNAPFAADARKRARMAPSSQLLCPPE